MYPSALKDTMCGYIQAPFTAWDLGENSGGFGNTQASKEWPKCASNTPYYRCTKRKKFRQR